MEHSGLFFIVAGLYCDAAWDEIYCWPPTGAGENVSRSCSEVMKDDPEIPNAEDILGIGFFIVLQLWQTIHCPAKLSVACHDSVRTR